MKCNRVEN